MNITKSGNVTKSGNGYFTDDAEYIVSRDGASIKRGDGSRMIVPAGEDAHDIAEAGITMARRPETPCAPKSRHCATDRTGASIVRQNEHQA